MLSPLSDSGFLGQRVDFVFYGVLLVSMACFWGGEVFWWLQKLKGKGSKNIEKKHFEVAWSIIPLSVLLFLTCVETQFFSPRNLRLKALNYFQPQAPISNPDSQKIRNELRPDLKNKKNVTPVVRM